MCGSIELALTPPTDFVGHCHCESCRRSHGAAFVTWTSVPIDRFAFTRGEEEVRWYRSSAWIEWGFCGNCGSSMLYRAIGEGHPEKPQVDRMYVTAASLDGLDRAPGEHVSFEERVEWVALHDDLPKYRGKTKEEIA